MLYGITREDIMKLVHSRDVIVYRYHCYIIRDARRNQMVAIGFDTWVDALSYLLEDVEVIFPKQGLSRKTPIRFSKAKA